MLIIFCAFVLVLGTEVSGQLFQARFGFPIEFPGFSDPEAFGEEGFQDIQSRVADMMKESKKPKKGVRTKVKTEHKGDANITTVEQKGKGYDSWSRLTTFGDGQKKSGKSFSQMMKGIFGGTIGKQTDKKQSECSGQKPCKGDKYCDPLDGTCKDKAGVGERCFMKDQCKKDNGVICIWGRCSPGKLGQAGTFCKKDEQCVEDHFCGEDSKFIMFQKICKPKLDEGASCGGVTPLGIFRIAIGKRDIEAQQKITNPCKTGLKCEEAGMFGGMICVPETLKIKKDKQVKVQEGKKPSGGDENDDEDNDEEETSSGNQEGTAEKPENEEGGDIVPSKEQEDSDEKPANVQDAKPENTDNNNNTGIAQSGQQQPPKGKKPPIPALNPKGTGPQRQRKKKSKKNRRKEQRKE